MMNFDPFGNEIDPITGMPVEQAQQFSQYLNAPPPSSGMQAYGLTPQSMGGPAEIQPGPQTPAEFMQAGLPYPGVSQPVPVGTESQPIDAYPGSVPPTIQTLPRSAGLLDGQGVPQVQAYEAPQVDAKDKPVKQKQPNGPAMGGPPGLQTPPGMAGVMDEKRAAVDAGTQADMEATRVRGEGQDQLINQIHQAASANAQAAQEENDINAGLSKDISSQYDAVQKAASTKIDPSHWWNNKSTAGKIAAGISVALGGIYQGIEISQGNSGAINPAVSNIKQAIADDMNHQREDREANMQGAQAGLQKSTTLGQLSRGSMQDKRAQRDQQQALGFKLAELQLDRSLLGVTDKKTIANAQALKAGISEEGMKFATDAYQKERAYRLQAHADKRADYLAGAQVGNLLVDNQMKQQQLDQKGAKSALGPGGDSYTQFGPARNKEAADRVSAFAVNYKSAQDDFKTINSLATKGSSLSPSDRKMAAAAAASLTFNMGQNLGLKQLTSDEQKAMSALQGGEATDILYSLPVLQNLERKLQMREADLYKADLLPGYNARPNVEGSTGYQPKTGFVR